MSKKKQVYSTSTFVVLVILIATLIFNFYNEYKENSGPAGTLKVHYIDVGQGDSIFVECDGQTLLIDAGDNGKGSIVSNYLKRRNVKTLDYVIATHPHADHIGGMAYVFNKFKVKKIIMPNKSTNTKTFENLLDAIDREGIKITKPEVGNEYSLGNATFTIVDIPPQIK